MTGLTHRILCLAAVALGMLLVQAHAQSPATLRTMLAEADFTDGATGAGARDLDRALTSSEFGTSTGSFVAAYYFNDESQNQILGPLHVSRFDRPTRRWIHAAKLDPEIVGSVLNVSISARYAILWLHWNPSAGQGVVFDARTLALLGTFDGHAERELQDGSIVYSGNVRHFAPTHQYRLFIFEPRSKRSTELFPGRGESPIAAEYRSKVRSAYAQLPQASREEFEQSVYGAVDDFDREIGSVVDGAGGRAIALSVTYSGGRLENFAPMQTVVRCQRQSDAWSCEETPIEQASRATGVTVWRDVSGRYDPMRVEELLRALVNR